MFYILTDALAEELLAISPDAAWMVEGVGYVVDDKRLADLSNGDPTIADRVSSSVMDEAEPVEGDALNAMINPVITVDQTFDATFQVVNEDIHPLDNSTSTEPTDVELKDKFVDERWSRSGNKVTFKGAADKVKGYISIRATDEGRASYWSRPKLRVLRDGEEIAVIDDLAMQQNTAYDGDAVVNGVFFDKPQAENPVYSFEWFDKDRRWGTLKPTESSQIAVEATVKVKVMGA